MPKFFNSGVDVPIYQTPLISLICKNYQFYLFVLDVDPTIIPT